MRLSTTAEAGLAAVALTAAVGCGGGGGPAAPTAPRGNLVIRGYNSNGASLGTATYENVSGGTLSITLQDLAAKGLSSSGIDASFAVLRLPESGSELGSLVVNTSTGRLTFPATPGELSFYGFDTSNGANYECAFGTGFGQRLPARHATVRKLAAGEAFPLAGVTVIDPPPAFEDLIPEALSKLNAALTVGGLRYGSLSWVGTQSGATLAGGFASPIVHPQTQRETGGYHKDGKFVIEAEQSRFLGERVALEEVFEAYAGDADDICGERSVASLLERTVLSAKGNDLVRFVALFR